VQDLSWRAVRSDERFDVVFIVRPGLDVDEAEHVDELHDLSDRFVRVDAGVASSVQAVRRWLLPVHAGGDCMHRVLHGSISEHVRQL
jgi:hypothetical protein